MAGVRLKNTLLNTYKDTDVKHIALCCYANSFANYTTTKEEYDQQHYEGAATLFGPNQLEAIQQEYRKIAEKIKDDEFVPPGLPFPKISSKIKKLRFRVRFDDDPAGKDYGDVLTQPSASYKCEEKVSVEFVGANPRNNLKIMDTFLEVQRYNNGTWETAYRDLDFETVFHWKRKGRASHSYITIEWNIPKNEKAGIYRIVYYGDSKNRWTRKITPFSGISNTFEVINISE
ncbi:MAG: hypothetical protein FK733_11715 [Asgard group archaeon]|nr:hypothetical protein [Asgard group archaeon]